MDLLSPQINYPFYPSVSSFSNDFYDDYLTTEELVIPLTPKYLNLHQRQLPALYPNYLLNNPNNLDFNKLNNQYKVIEEEIIDMSNISNQQPARNRYDFRGSNGMINGLGIEMKPNFMESYVNPFNRREITEEHIDLSNFSKGEEIYNSQRRSSFKKIYPAGPYGLAQPGLNFFINSEKNLFLLKRK